MRLVSKTNAILAVGGVALIAATALPASASCFSFNHPRRAEVLRRDAVLNCEINHDRGYLSGNYGRLRGEDLAIARQEQHDAFLNGGYITRGEQWQLNHEENRLQHQINRSYI